MDVTDRATGIRVIGRSRRSVHADLGAEWRRLDDPTVPDPDVTGYDTHHWIRVEAERVRVPSVGVAVIDAETGDREFLDDNDDRLGVSTDDVVAFRTGVILLAYPESNCTVSRTTDTTNLTVEDDTMAVCRRPRLGRSVSTVHRPWPLRTRVCNHTE
jgi:hypothetical protein